MRTRIALDPAITEDEVRRAMYVSDLNVVDEIPPTDESPAEVVFASTDEAVTVHYVQDDFIGFDYVVVTSDEPSLVEEVADELRGELRHVTRDQVLARAAGAARNAEFAAALYLAGIIAMPEPDAELLALFDHAFGSDDVELRRAAVFASGYAEWRELDERLRLLIEREEDPALVEQAEAMLEGLEMSRTDPAS